MKNSAIAIVASACLAVLGTVASASVSYSYATDAPAYNVSGGSATVNVYLQETLTDGSSSLIASDQGLFSAGFKVTLSSGGGVKLSGISFNKAEFGYSELSQFSDSVASLAEAVDLSAASGPVADGSGRVLLGSVTLVPSATGTAPAVFSVGRYSDLGGNTATFGSFYDLDFSSSDPAFAGAEGQTTFGAAVPEPTALGAALVSLLAVRRRARR